MSSVKLTSVSFTSKFCGHVSALPVVCSPWVGG